MNWHFLIEVSLQNQHFKMFPSTRTKYFFSCFVSARKTNQEKSSVSVWNSNSLQLGFFSWVTEQKKNNDSLSSNWGHSTSPGAWFLQFGNPATCQSHPELPPCALFLQAWWWLVHQATGCSYTTVKLPSLPLIPRTAWALNLQCASVTLQAILWANYKTISPSTSLLYNREIAQGKGNTRATQTLWKGVLVAP